MVWQVNGKDLENLMMHGGESLLNNKKSDSPNSSVENDAKDLITSEGSALQEHTDDLKQTIKDNIHAYKYVFQQYSGIEQAIDSLQAFKDSYSDEIDDIMHGNIKDAMNKCFEALDAITKIKDGLDQKIDDVVDENITQEKIQKVFLDKSLIKAESNKAFMVRLPAAALDTNENCLWISKMIMHERKNSYMVNVYSDFQFDRCEYSFPTNGKPAVIKSKSTVNAETFLQMVKKTNEFMEHVDYIGSLFEHDPEKSVIPIKIKTKM